MFFCATGRNNCRRRPRGVLDPGTDRFDSGQGRGYITHAMPTVLRFIQPCLPSPADRPPSGSGWLHEIKHDGYRLMARRDTVGIRLITRRGNDWTDRFPLGRLRGICHASKHLRLRKPRPVQNAPSDAANTRVQTTGYGGGGYGSGPMGGAARVMLEGAGGADMEFSAIAQNVHTMWLNLNGVHRWW